jgi:hypothetical protein
MQAEEYPLQCGFFMTHMKVICMKKIALSVTTALIASALLVACNADSINASDVSSPGAAVPLSKAACTSLANWQSVGIGMSATQVQERLGAPAKIISVPPDTQYHYERCRGFWQVDKEATETTAATTFVTDVGGIVVISGARGVISVTSPERIDKKIICEYDYHNYSEEAGVCRTSRTPF